MSGKVIISLLFQDGECKESSDITIPCDKLGFKDLMESLIAKSQMHVAEPENQAEFMCLECGHKFYSAHAAEAAAFGDGCPDCGGSDIEVA